MMQQTSFHSLSQHRYIPLRDYMRDEDFEQVEADIKDLRTAVAEARDMTWSAWSGAGTQIQETADALSLKADVILWRLRVAKHFTYPARDVLWEDIKTSIADFEEMADPIVRHRM